MDNIEIARAVVTTTASLGGGLLATSAIQRNCSPARSRILRGCQYMGMFSLSGLVGSAAGEYAGKQFDDFVDLFKSDASSKKS